MLPISDSADPGGFPSGGPELTQDDTGSKEILTAALDCLRAGLSVVADVPGQKRPISEWKHLQTARMDEQTARSIFAGDVWLGIVTGVGSGNAEMIDFDCEAVLYDAWAELVEAARPGLTARLTIERSVSGGGHVVYRCPSVQIPGNTQLAFVRRIAQTAEKRGDSYIVTGAKGKQYPARPLPDGGFEYFPVAIESRGQGGQFVCAPSPGYRLRQGTFTALPEITAEERETLWNSARAVCQKPRVPPPVKLRPQTDAGREWSGTSTADDYGRRADVPELLRRWGWREWRGDYWTRPGKDAGVSGALHDGKVFYCFSSNAEPLRAQTAYSPAQLYAALEHGGDVSAACKALYSRGYGTRQTRRAGVGAVAAGDAATAPPRAPDADAHAPPPGLPLETFPEWVQEWTRNVAEYAQTPEDMPALAILGVTSLLAARSGIAASWAPGHRETCNLYVLLVAESSEHKTTCLDPIVRPLSTREEALLAAHREAHERWGSRLKDMEAHLDRARRGGADTETLRQALAAHREGEPREPCLLLDDVTPEAMALHLEHNRCVGFMLSEGTVITNMLDRYSDVQAIEPWVRLWDGKGEWKRTRKGGGTVLLRDRMAAICTFVQHSRLRQLASEVKNAEDVGLLSRFLYSLPASRIGSRDQGLRGIDPVLAERWGRFCSDCMALQERTLTLSPAAARALVDHAAMMERALQRGSAWRHSGLAPWLGKMQKGQLIRLAAVLHVLHGRPETEVSAETMAAATRWSEYFLYHAQLALDTMRSTDEDAVLERICAWGERRTDGFSVRDAYTNLHLDAAQTKAVCSAAVGTGRLTVVDGIHKVVAGGVRKGTMTLPFADLLHGAALLPRDDAAAPTPAAGPGCGYGEDVAAFAALHGEEKREGKAAGEMPNNAANAAEREKREVTPSSSLSYDAANLLHDNAATTRQRQQTCPSSSVKAGTAGSLEDDIFGPDPPPGTPPVYPYVDRQAGAEPAKGSAVVACGGRPGADGPAEYDHFWDFMFDDEPERPALAATATARAGPLPAAPAGAGPGTEEAECLCGDLDL